MANISISLYIPSHTLFGCDYDAKPEQNNNFYNPSSNLQCQNELIFACSSTPKKKKNFLTNIFHKVKLARFYLPIIPGVGVKFFAKLFVSIDIEKIDAISQESQQISQLLTWNSR